MQGKGVEHEDPTLEFWIDDGQQTDENSNLEKPLRNSPMSNKHFPPEVALTPTHPG